MQLSVASLGYEPTRAFLENVALAERLGLDGYFHNDAKWRREVFSRLGAAAATSSRLRLGISVLDPYTRHPALVAQATATLAEMTPGRPLSVVMGSGSHFDSLPGYANRKPVRALRETLQLLRGLWAGETVSIDGEIVKFEAGRFEFEPSATPEAWIASRGQQILGLAGEVADGVLIGSFATPPGIEYAKGCIAAGLARAGRGWEEIQLASWLYTSVLADPEEDIPDAVRLGIAHAFWSSRKVLTEMIDVLAPDASDEFREFLATPRPQEWSEPVMAELQRLLPRGLMDSLAVIGTAEQVAAKLLALEQAGVQQAVLWPFPRQGQSTAELIGELASGVLPTLR